MPSVRRLSTTACVLALLPPARRHTNYILLGMAIETLTGEKMSDLLSDRVLRPLELTNTVASLTAEIPPPVLHAFSSERREALGIPPFAGIL